jgi:hypothetical protein
LLCNLLKFYICGGNSALYKPKTGIVHKYVCKTCSKSIIKFTIIKSYIQFINVKHALKVSSNTIYTVEFPKTCERGRPKNPNKYLKELKYAQMIKEREGQNLI